MGYAGKLDLKLKAQFLRKKGLSVKEIQKELKVSRSSVSLWVRNIQLNKKQLKRLYLNKKTGALKGSIIGAKKKQREREDLTRKLIIEGRKEVGNVSTRDRFIAGIAMYFAEGDKKDGHIGFCNTDPNAIRFMVDWIREFCNLPKEKLRGALYIHDDLDEKKAKKYWSELTGIPLTQFTKSYIAKNNLNRLRKKKHIYGVFRVSTSSVVLHRKLMGWINRVLDVE